MLSWLRRVLQDERNEPSSKRVIALVGAMCLFIALMFGLNPSPGVITGVVTVISVCLGAATADKFSV